MSLTFKQYLIVAVTLIFLLSLVFVQWMETARKAEEAGIRPPHISVPANSRECVECHAEENPGIVAHWEGITHAEKGVGCVECHFGHLYEKNPQSHQGLRVRLFRYHVGSFVDFGRFVNIVRRYSPVRGFFLKMFGGVSVSCT